jgi:hypothetical protein
MEIMLSIEALIVLLVTEYYLAAFAEKEFFFFLPDYSRAMCNSAPMENRNHTFFTCLFPLCAGNIFIQLGCLQISAYRRPMSWLYMEFLKTSVGQPFFFEIIVLISWAI